MGRKITVAVVAIGGYGSGYVHALLQPKFRKLAAIVAGIDPVTGTCEDLGRLRKMKVPIYPSFDAFFEDIGCGPSSASRRIAGRFGGQAPDLVIISSPIHLHAVQAIEALEHGSNVLCEKPMCATVEEAYALRDARDRSGRFVAIGYQRSFAPGTVALHRAARAGLFGRPKRLKAIVLWPRDAGYYGRNNWAGMQKSPDGRWVLDSPANNATAHYLHAMFHLLGGRRDTAGVPAEVTAELYRANDITNFDTAAIRAVTTDGVPVFFVTSHAVDRSFGPTFRYEFEKAVLEPDDAGGTVARFRSGRVKRYRGLKGNDIDVKLSEALRLAGAGKTNVACGIEAAFSQTLCINGAQDSTARIVSLKKLRRAQGEGDKRVWYVPGLADVLTECYRKGKLPSELGAPWAKPGKRIDLADYRRFPGGR